MTSIEINIAIAEACGWTDISQYTQAVDGWYGYEPEDGPHSQVPNYCSDLNAMHEAEKVIKINSHLWKPYESFLARIVSGDCGMFHITAKQRAEAFLRTFGKWEE